MVFLSFINFYPACSLAAWILLILLFFVVFIMCLFLFSPSEHEQGDEEKRSK